MNGAFSGSLLIWANKTWSGKQQNAPRFFISAIIITLHQVSADVLTNTYICCNRNIGLKKKETHKTMSEDILAFNELLQPFARTFYQVSFLELQKHVGFKWH